MAPQSALQGNRPRPTTRHIVPAIPLPYMQKRKQPTQASLKKIEKETVVIPVEKEPVAAPIETSIPSPPSVEKIVTENGATSTESHDRATITPANDKRHDSEESKAVANEAHQSPKSTAKELTAVKEKTTTPPSSENNSESRSTYQMPPPFVPASNSYSNQPADSVRFPRQPPFGVQQLSMHHPHPSTGSLIFGGYSDSSNSSPAPPLSGGGAAPPAHQAAVDTRRSQPPQYENGSHMHNYSNGYSPMGPAPNGLFHRTDGFASQNSGRPFPPFGPLEGFSSVGVEPQRFSGYEANAAQSFHGSQSSAQNQNEQDSNGHQFYTQHGASGTNGNNGQFDDTSHYHQSRSKPRNGSQAANTGHYTQTSISGPPPMPPTMDSLDGLLGYLQNQFADPRFADYTLELRYSDDRAAPVRIPGHNLLFARSPALKRLMTAQAQEANSDGLSLKTLFIESDDRFLCSDGFGMAAQRLYGGPLLYPGAPINAMNGVLSQANSSMAGTPPARFSLALGYAAAGHILEMPPVVNRGIEIATHFISWETVENALDFALDGGLDSQWTLEPNQHAASPSTYGPAVNMLIHSALNFIITSFPPNFELDTSVPEPSHNRRLPNVPEERVPVANHRLSAIKFGDHTSDEESHEGKVATNTTTVTLSKILINLHFTLLKYVLESSRLGNVSGWATSALRQKVMRAVIEEREIRRIKVYNNRNVRRAEREANHRTWEAVGWREILNSYGPNDTNILGREWVEFILPDGS